MEILELPVTQESDEIHSWPELAPANFTEDQLDIAAFQLWRESVEPDDISGQDKAETS
jgi:hypothetical protein